jgi:pimeloyl-ACP methyl ester carboxylesterase
VIGAAAQTKPMVLNQAKYEIQAGVPVPLSASSDAVDFVLKANKVSVTPAVGLVVGPNRAGNQVMVAATARAKPGEYAVTLSATSATGEQRQAAMDVVVKPQVTVPSTATRAPVVLLNGWETLYTNACPVSADSTVTFGNLAQYLTSDGVPVVYFFDNCAEDPNQPIENLAQDLATFLGTIKYDNGSQVPQIDLVAFSLGGLVARAYLAGLQPDETLTPPATTLIRDLVLIAVPN